MTAVEVSNLISVHVCDPSGILSGDILIDCPCGIDFVYQIHYPVFSLTNHSTSLNFILQQYEVGHLNCVLALEDVACKLWLILA